jgi:hypothetical protein
VFIVLHCATSLIVKLADQLGVAGARNRLCLPATHLLCSIIERFANMTGCARKRICHLARRLVCQVAHPIGRLVQHLGLTPLQFMPAAGCPLGAFALSALRLLEVSQLLVAPLQGSFDCTTAHQDGLLAIRCGNQRVDPQVDADFALLWTRFVRDFANQQ